MRNKHSGTQRFLYDVQVLEERGRRWVFGESTEDHRLAWKKQGCSWPIGTVGRLTLKRRGGYEFEPYPDPRWRRQEEFDVAGFYGWMTIGTALGLLLPEDTLPGSNVQITQPPHHEFQIRVPRHVVEYYAQIRLPIQCLFSSFACGITFGLYSYKWRTLQVNELHAVPGQTVNYAVPLNLIDEVEDRGLKIEQVFYGRLNESFPAGRARSRRQRPSR